MTGRVRQERYKTHLDMYRRYFSVDRPSNEPEETEIAKKHVTLLRVLKRYRWYLLSAFLCIALFVLIAYSFEPSLRITRTDGKTMYMPRELYRKALDSLEKDCKEALGICPVLDLTTSETFVPFFLIKTEDLVSSILSFSGDKYGYRQVFSCAGQDLCAVTEAEKAKAEAIIKKALADTLLLYKGADEVVADTNITCKEKLVAQKDFSDLNTLYTNLTKLQGQELYCLKEGETGLTVADSHSISRACLQAINPDKPLLWYTEGDTIILHQGNSVFSIKAFYTISVTDRIPYEVEEKRTRTLLIGESQIKEKGVIGLIDRKVTVSIEDGQASVIQELEQEVCLQPKNELVYRGSRRDDGRLFYTPVDSQKISSYFGPRILRGKANNHKGVDFPVKEGTYVYAAADGIVTKCGVFGNRAYGKAVVIDHGNGFVTYYAHNSKLLVSVGDKVVKGEAIAKSGNSGNSTAPHVHFEVRKDGEAVDPFLYMEKP